MRIVYQTHKIASCCFNQAHIPLSLFSFYRMPNVTIEIMPTNTLEKQRLTIKEKSLANCAEVLDTNAFSNFIRSNTNCQRIKAGHVRAPQLWIIQTESQNRLACFGRLSGAEHRPSEVVMKGDFYIAFSPIQFHFNGALCSRLISFHFCAPYHILYHHIIRYQ